MYLIKKKKCIITSVYSSSLMFQEVLSFDFYEENISYTDVVTSTCRVSPVLNTTTIVLEERVIKLCTLLLV